MLRIWPWLILIFVGPPIALIVATVWVALTEPVFGLDWFRLKKRVAEERRRAKAPDSAA